MSAFGIVSVFNGSSGSFGFFMFLDFLLWIALTVMGVLATIKGLYYVFTQYVMFESGNSLHGKEAAENSEKLMQGKRGEYFVFILSFLGWIILGAIPFGIGLLWVLPYVQISSVIFYENLKGIPKEAKEPEVEKTE